MRKSSFMGGAAAHPRLAFPSARSLRADVLAGTHFAAKLAFRRCREHTVKHTSAHVRARTIVRRIGIVFTIPSVSKFGCSHRSRASMAGRRPSFPNAERADGWPADCLHIREFHNAEPALCAVADRRRRRAVGECVEAGYSNAPIGHKRASPSHSSATASNKHGCCSR